MCAVCVTCVSVYCLGVNTEQCLNLYITEHIKTLRARSPFDIFNEIKQMVIRYVFYGASVYFLARACTVYL